MCNLSMFILIFIAIIQHYIIPIKSHVLYLRGESYNVCKEKNLFNIDIDYAFRKETLALMPTSKPPEIATSEHWERSNCLSMMSIKSRITTSVLGSLPKCEIVKDLMKAINP